ncbi:MAG TPA: GrpB family protein, partial [Terriglobia bacterium]|nr:GrpB family protein [Terriglobia bacterium]
MADSLGLEPGIVRLVEYDARWPALFSAEQQRICDRCGKLVLRLEHVGGTSIPGMCAKPVLDIAAGRPQDTSTQDYVAALEHAGYEHRGERGVPGRQFFCRGQPRAYHVHLVEEGGPLWRDYVAFRDYLGAHAEAARQFADLKRVLA